MPHPGRAIYTDSPMGSTTSVDRVLRMQSLEPGDDYFSRRADESDPFATPYTSHASPYTSQPVTRAGTPVAQHQADLSKRYFHSRRVKKGQVEKPGRSVKEPREKWITIIPLLGILVGLGIAGILVWDGMRDVVHNQYCLIYSDDFASGLDPKIWTKEAEVGGFGNGQFDETTSTDENVFVANGELHIKSTLQDAALINNNSVIDLTKGSICTSDILTNCITPTNTTNGTIVSPAKSGRLNTKKGAAITYGRVEVTARLPSGDWLWPAIWLLPLKSTYGPWPQSGEIDILESRGNNHTYPQGGNNIASSALHWGPNSANDAWWRTNVKRTALHSTYAQTFHTFGLEWSEKYLFTYIDTRLLQVLYTNFNTPLWQRGDFPLSDSNGTRLVDPWSQTGHASTPFDQDFYLILNVAVGGTNGWFEEGVAGKPWVDGSPTARKDFWDARGQWLPTWEKGGEMVVRKVEMWQQKGYKGC